MTITVLLFAMLRTKSGTDTVILNMDADTPAEAIKAILLSRFPEIAAWLPYARPAINCNYTSWNTLLRDGDEVALLLPVSGG